MRRPLQTPFVVWRTHTAGCLVTSGMVELPVHGVLLLTGHGARFRDVTFTRAPPAQQLPTQTSLNTSSLKACASCACHSCACLSALADVSVAVWQIHDHQQLAFVLHLPSLVALSRITCMATSSESCHVSLHYRVSSTLLVLIDVWAAPPLCSNSDCMLHRLHECFHALSHISHIGRSHTLDAPPGSGQVAGLFILPRVTSRPAKFLRIRVSGSWASGVMAIVRPLIIDDAMPLPSTRFLGNGHMGQCHTPHRGLSVHALCQTRRRPPPVSDSVIP